MADDPNVDLTIPMLPNMELTATTVAESLGVFMGLDADKIEEVKIALIEGCINAFEHSKSEDGRIDISFQINERGLTVAINDGGQGFDLEEARRRIQDKREKGLPRGWGLTLIEELMDELEIDSTDKGTVITMTKYR
jgi:anti-sigma regulatory factor (Ser/Thr protein kinase)